MPKRLTTYGHNHSRADWERTLDNSEPFTASAILGRTIVPGEGLSTGRLPDDWARTFTTRVNVGVVDYVVWSYQTPIAWHDIEAGWVIPNVQYSPTTSKHQGLIRRSVFDYVEG